MAELLTFGCRLNAAESAAIATMATGVDAVIVNTCAVTLEAERDARRAIARLVRDRPGTPVIVTGCAATIDPARWAALPGVARVLDNTQKLRADTWGGPAADAPFPVAPPVSAGRARTVLDVQQGCDHACTFCIIPAGRGAARSAPAYAVGERLRQAAAAGVAEVVLTGVDLASWRGASGGLADLVREALRAAPRLPRLRLSSLDPAALDEAFWRVFADEPRLMPFLHLSLQSASDLVLKRMRRRHSRAQVQEVVARARACRPGVGLGADLIAGFPTETDAHAQETHDLVVACALPYLHVFPYSARPGTPAARMPQVPVPVRWARAAALRAAGRMAAARFHAGLVGTEREIVVEQGGRGHTPEGAPVAGLGLHDAGRLVRRTIRASTADGVHV